MLTDRYTASRRHGAFRGAFRRIPGRWPGGCFRLMALQVPQPLVEVELTFGQTVTVNATCLFMHPHHNMASWLVKLLVLRKLDTKIVVIQSIGHCDLFHVRLSLALWKYV